MIAVGTQEFGLLNVFPDLEVPMSHPVALVVSESRLLECEVSARFWATNLGLYADRMRRLADRYAISAALISTITGFSVWTTLAASPKWYAVLAVSTMAFIAAAVGVIPKIRGYNDCAEATAALAPRYASILGRLGDARRLISTGHPEAARLAEGSIGEFEETKRAKDSLKPFPAELQREINALREEGIIVPHEPA